MIKVSILYLVDDQGSYSIVNGYIFEDDIAYFCEYPTLINDANPTLVVLKNGEKVIIEDDVDWLKDELS